ncbi:hypothetical protein GCM10027517_11880 [Phycicoccus ginsengisoli]
MRRQTSVRLTDSALSRISDVCAHEGLSRDALLYRLVTDHVHTQAALDEESRLVHISTVISWPPPAPGARGGQHDGRRRVALRLDKNTIDLAKNTGFVLPGQAPARGPKHYKARSLTDAVTTALAVAHPYDEAGLEDLPATLTHRQALALWRLTVAATSTRAEQHALYGGGTIADILREEDVSWHHPWRFQIALHLAQHLLIGPNAATNLAMLHTQGPDFHARIHDLELTDDFTDDTWLAGAPNPTEDLQGRGGAAVWRAERKAAREHIPTWLRSAPHPAPHTVHQPGWELTIPNDWVGITFRTGDHVPEHLLRDITADRVLRVDDGSHFTLWPYQAGSPVPGFDHILKPLLGHVQPAVIVEVVLANTEQLLAHPRLPAPVAHELGFITTTERDNLITAAADATSHSINDAALADYTLTDYERDELDRARHDLTTLIDVARQVGLRFRVTEPSWTWEVTSIADELAAGSLDGNRLEYLAGAVHNIHGYALEISMRGAWSTAFHVGRAYPDDDS